MLLKEPDFKNLKLKKATAISRQILLSFLDITRFSYTIFDPKNLHHAPLEYFDKFREKDKLRFSQEMSRLSTAGFIKKYFDGKSEIIELKPKGINQIKNFITLDMEISAPKKWDKKWRMVIYDIPNDKKDRRETLRNKLESLSFYQLQESVYVFPFECQNEIEFLKKLYLLEYYIQFLVADRIETETNLIKIFLDRGILKKSML